MRTPAVLDLPRPPQIKRARCAECKSVEMPYGYFWQFPSVAPINFLSDYLWKFNNALSQFFFFMYMDFRYGFVLYRSDVVGGIIPDYGWIYPNWDLIYPNWGLTYSIYIPPGELTIPSDELRINIDGITYTKVWDGAVHTIPSAVDAVTVTESVDMSITDVVVYHSGYYAPRIHKTGYDRVSVPIAWDEHDIADVAGGEGVLEGRAVTWGCAYSFLGYGAGGAEICLVFDTTDTPPGAVSRTLRFIVDFIGDIGYGTPVLEFVSISGELVVADYDTGTLIDTLSIPAAGTYSITLPDAYINYGGITRVKLSLTSLEGDQIDEAYVNSVVLKINIATHTRITFVY